MVASVVLGLANKPLIVFPVISSTNVGTARSTKYLNSTTMMSALSMCGTNRMVLNKPCSGIFLYR